MILNIVAQNIGTNHYYTYYYSQVIYITNITACFFTIVTPQFTSSLIGHELEKQTNISM